MIVRTRIACCALLYSTMMEIMRCTIAGYSLPRSVDIENPPKLSFLLHQTLRVYVRAVNRKLAKVTSAGL